MSESLKTIAAFDFDGTLTYRDSLLSFLIFAVGPVRTILYLLLELPYLLGFCMGVISRQKVKEAVLTRFFLGESIEALKKKGESFAKNHLPSLVRPEGLERIIWHRNQGHRCILVSANLALYLEPWSKANGFDVCLATRLEVTSSGKVTGRLEGLNCRGEEKVCQLKKNIGNERVILYAYGDSDGDRELLTFADYPYYRKLK